MIISEYTFILVGFLQSLNFSIKNTKVKNMTIVAVIPAYNEEKSVGEVVSNTLKYVDQVIVVDDESQDSTSEIASQAGAKVVRLIVNMGAGFATRVGCDIAYNNGADILVTIDADSQHDPSEIPKLVKILKKENLDIVFGSRPRNEKMPMIKRIGNFGLSSIASLLFRIKIKDSQTGFHAFIREAYEKLRWNSSRYGVVSEFVVKTAKNKLRFKEVEVKTIYTGKKVGMGKRDALKSVLKMFWWRIRE